MEILPAILAEDAETFRERLTFPGLWEAGMTAHIDILDGSMFGATCFCDPTALHASPQPSPYQERELRRLPAIELHCMVRNPIPVIERWKTLVPETVRAIVHAEIDRPLDELLHRIHGLDLESGVALCPETPTTVIESLPDLVDRVLIMGIHPGASGRPFLGEPILAKMRRLRSLFPQLHLSLDGGASLETITAIERAGASSMIAGSAVWSGYNPRAAYEQLIHATPSRQ